MLEMLGVEEGSGYTDPLPLTYCQATRVRPRVSDNAAQSRRGDTSAVVYWRRYISVQIEIVGTTLGGIRASGRLDSHGYGGRVIRCEETATSIRQTRVQSFTILTTA